MTAAPLNTAKSSATGSGSGLGMAVAGMMLIAATYGMARFGVGLFAPYLAAERPELIEVLGLAAAAQFIAYSVAAVVAARLVDLHPRTGLVLAGATGTLGCLGVAVASDPVFFIASVIIGGMGGGFASPALVPVIDAMVAARATATAQSVVNTGTGVGVIGAGVVAFIAPSIESAWLLMGLFTAAAATAVIYPLRGRAIHPPKSPAPAGAKLAWSVLLVPGIAAVVAGIGSALIWTFGPILITDSGAVSADHVGSLWIALGVGGLLGSFTGALVAGAGQHGGWFIAASALALASGLLAWSWQSQSPWLAYASMALFGAGYMALSGVLILWARNEWPQHAGAGTSVLFIALATGQAIGSAGFGAAQGSANPVLLAILAACLCLAGGGVATIGTWIRSAKRCSAGWPRSG